MEQLEHILPQLEKAASVMMTPSLAELPDEIHSAENIFLEFRRSKHPYNICKQILETSKVDYVLFESASTIKEAIIREWSLLENSDIDGLCSFLLNYVTQQKSLKKFVRELIVQVVAIILKRRTLDKSSKGCSNLLISISQLLREGDIKMQLICCSILKALLTEYSNTELSSNVGLSLEHHAECQITFENENLLSILLLSVEVLQRFSESESNAFSEDEISPCVYYLFLTQQILSWNFLSGNHIQLLRSSSETMRNNLFRPPKFWKATVLDPYFIDIFFKLYKRYLNNKKELSDNCLQCLVHLASLTGPVFINQQMKIEYLNHLLNGFIQLMNRNQWTSAQAFASATFFMRIVNVFTTTVIASLPINILKPFFETLAALTCNFQELALIKDEDYMISEEFEEAVDLLFDTWVILIINSSSFPDGYFMCYAVQIFNSYIKTHLSMPNGMRRVDNDSKELDEIDNEIVESDRIAYADELNNIGYISRLALSHSIPSLSYLIQARTQWLLQFFDVFQSGDTMMSADELYEDLHWLLLIATNVITTEVKSESASIPSEILQYEMCLQERSIVDVTSNVQFLFCLGENSSEDNVDIFIVLITRILSLSKLICQAIKNNLSEIISPEVLSDLLWFLQCWTSSYLFTKETDEMKLPDVFKSAFSETSDCGKQIVTLILDVIETHLIYSSAEETVTNDAVQLLLKFVQSDSRISVALQLPHLWRFAEQHSKQSSSLRILSPSVYRHLLHALMNVASHIQQQDLREKFLHQFLDPFQASYKSIIKHPSFDNIHQNEPVRQRVIYLIETMRGITMATDSANVDMIFQFISPYVHDVTSLLQKYANCPEIVELIIEFFIDVVQSEIIYLNKEKSNALCGLCVELISNYSKYNLGRIRESKTGVYESYNEIFLLMRLLTHILSKDYLDFSSDAECNADGSIILNAVEAVFHGLYIIIPLMNAELLQFPKFSFEYFKLVTSVCECYPEKIVNLREDLFKTLTSTLEVAFLHYRPDVAKNSLEALASIASHCYKSENTQSLVPSHVDHALKHFLKVVFDFILSSGFDMDLIQPASEVLFILICCNQMEYIALAQGLLANQSDLGILQRLRTSLEQLTPTSLNLTIDNSSKRTFRKNLEIFLPNVKGLLCYK